MNKALDDQLCSFGKHKGVRLADIEARYWVWCWNEFLHKQTTSPEHQYIKQNIAQLDRETDLIFKPDPRTLR